MTNRFHTYATAVALAAALALPALPDNAFGDISVSATETSQPFAATTAHNKTNNRVAQDLLLEDSTLNNDNK